MGHALVALALPGSDRIQKVSIIPRCISSLGDTIQRPTEDRYFLTREGLENKMAVCQGGRAAAVLIFDKLATGPPMTSTRRPTSLMPLPPAMAWMKPWTK
jgi:cell division protease FtsH